MRAYDKAVLAGLGIDKHPELAPLYFGNYRRLVYLSQAPDEKLLTKGQVIAESMGRTLSSIAPVGYGALETRLMALMQGQEQPA